jgi:hypothetical protein
MTRKQAARCTKEPYVEIVLDTTWDGYRRAYAIPLNDRIRARATRPTSTPRAAANPRGAVCAYGGHNCIAPDAELVEHLKGIVANIGYRVWEGD